MTVILCCGCSNHSSWQKAKDRYVVGVVTKSNTSEYWMSVNSGMEAAAAKYDMDVITLAPDSELDREVQEKQVEKLIIRMWMRWQLHRLTLIMFRTIWMK